jgi:hypothetical protein
MIDYKGKKKELVFYIYIHTHTHTRESYKNKKNLWFFFKKIDIFEIIRLFKLK